MAENNANTQDTIKNNKDKKEKKKKATQRKDDRRPDDQLTIYLFGNPLIIGGEYDARLIYEKDFELDSSKKDGLLLFRQEIEIEFLYTFNKDIYAFIEGKIQADNDLYREDDNEKFETALERGEMWVYFSNLATSDFDLQQGHDTR